MLSKYMVSLLKVGIDELQKKKKIFFTFFYFSESGS